MKFEKHLEITSAELSAAAVLKASTELSKQAIKRVMNKGAVWLTRDQYTQRIRRADKVLRPGDGLHLYYDDEVLAKQVDAPLLVADEGLYSIWVKPYGMLCQGSKWGDHCTINRWVEKNHMPQRSAFIVHRLDRAATGLMIIAHQKKIAAYFSTLFEQRKIVKCYQALVHGNFPDAQTFEGKIDGKPAMSHCKQLSYLADTNCSFIEVSIETGRKHQIRRHLSEAGYPIVGDRLYGELEDVADIDLRLTSHYLSFVSPRDKSEKHYILPNQLHLAVT
ncbi:MAG: RNA pseudouridine synthase [Gammaproteobacteria bacterium]|nr:RNA pseudouridine synthase [Gammaproteobacteria bacterium]